jgi:heme A synthase
MVLVVVAMHWIEKIPEDSSWFYFRQFMHVVHPLGSIIFLAYAVVIMTWQIVGSEPTLYVLYAICAIVLAYFKRGRARDKIAGH